MYVRRSRETAKFFTTSLITSVPFASSASGWLKSFAQVANNRRTRRGVRERRVDGHVVQRRKPQRATLPGFPIDTCAAGGMRETRRHEQRRPATSIASVNASLRLTGPPFGAMLRRPHAKLKRASNGQGPAASGHNPPVSTAAYRRWWRARFTEDELWDLAQAVWPNG